MNEGLDAIRKEIEEFGSPAVKECMKYVLDEEAGSSQKKFWPGIRDCDKDGNLLPERMKNGRGMKLEDFAACEQATHSELVLPEVAGLRIYTTAAYEEINNPLRDLGRYERNEAHNLPITVMFMSKALGKLRAVGADAHNSTKEVLVTCSNIRTNVRHLVCHNHSVPLPRWFSTAA